VAKKAMVNADLMGAPGVEDAKDQGRAVFRGVQEVKVGDGRLASSRVAHIHSLAVDRMARDIVENGLVNLCRRALRNAEIHFAGLSVSKLADKVPKGRVGFGGNKAA
jgi:hypothetical protein